MELWLANFPGKGQIQSAKNRLRWIAKLAVDFPKMLPRFFVCNNVRIGQISKMRYLWEDLSLLMLSDAALILVHNDFDMVTCLESN